MLMDSWQDVGEVLSKWSKYCCNVEGCCGSVVETSLKRCWGVVEVLL